PGRAGAPRQAEEALGRAWLAPLDAEPPRRIGEAEEPVIPAAFESLREIIGAGGRHGGSLPWRGVAGKENAQGECEGGPESHASASPALLSSNATSGGRPSGR